MNPKTAQVDPVTAAVIAGAFESIATEMGHKLARMSYSSIIRESEDFGCVICDARGQQLCEAPQSTPLQSGPIPGYVRGINRRFAELGDDWRPGDVVMHNHAYYGASHEPDVAFIIPVFHEGELVGFSATAAHHLDLGALVPGTVGIVEAVDAYAEGLQFNAVKVEEDGRVNEQVWRIVADNVRIPDMVVADMKAQIAAARVGAERYLEVIGRFGLDTVRAASDHLLDYSEGALRRAIEKLPDGRYEAEGFMDGFPEREDPRYRDWVVKVAITIDGSDMHVDLTGTSEQTDTPYNMPFEGTVDIAVLLTVRSILLDSAVGDPVPPNSGLFRPITIEAPVGCMANPIYPAATTGRAMGGNIVADTVMRALAPLVPDRVSAGIGNLKATALSGVVDGEPWVHMEIIEGSYGGRKGKDGLDAVDTLYANTRNNPIEDVESHYPLRVYRYELWEGAVGDGQWRGGLGCVRDIGFTAPGAYNIDGDGTRHAPPGLFGGEDGVPGSVILNPGTDRETVLPPKIAHRRAEPGDVLRFTGPAGGGYGPPADRDPAARAADIANGLVTE
jgi:N-methylhydantoinase B